MKKLSLLFIGLALGFVACDSDDSEAPLGRNNGGIDFEVPNTYDFSRNGKSSVSFGGQTTRLSQGVEILSDFKNFDATFETINNKFENGQGFDDATLNNGKIIKSKVAESVDYFSNNSVEQAAIRGDFAGYIDDHVSTILVNYNSIDEVPVAAKGSAGKLGKRLVNRNGLELDQAFNKGLIGALTLDQVINDYLRLAINDNRRATNDAGTLKEGKNYTEAEHNWDEAYGYVYGASDKDVLDNPNSRHLDNVVDSFLYKYIQRVEADADFKGIADVIFQAFKTGRAAIVAKNYKEANNQANILRKQLSNVIGIRAVYYLKQGANKIRKGGLSAINDGSAFHDWSEGYGFIYSLRFTQNPSTRRPYVSKTEVDGFIAQLEAGNGFWDLAETKNLTKIDAMAKVIAAKFDFTVAQAESTAAAN